MPRGKHGNHARGAANTRYNGGRSTSSHGYVKVQVGKGHHLADPNGYAYEHRLVVENVLCRRLVPGETVHHRNHNKADNRPANLEVLIRPEHARYHASERTRDEYGRMTGRDLAPPARDAKGRYLGGWPDKRGGAEALLDGERWTEMPQ